MTLSGYVHLNGRLVAASRAAVSVFDRGLLYGDGLFDTLRAYRGCPFGLRDHIERLERSARFLGIELPKLPWERHIGALLRKNGWASVDAWVRITVTRGVGVPALLPPKGIRPTVLLTSGRISAGLRRAQCNGVHVVLLPFARNGFLAEHKVLNYLPAILGRVFAAQHHAFEGLFVNSDGFVSEGTTSNVFVWRRNELITPPVVGLLPGLTRRLVIAIATADGLRVSERPLHTRDLRHAQEVMLTSSLAEVLPVASINGRAVGRGGGGPTAKRLLALYRQSVDRALFTQ